ncbi:unnamed protein product [Phytophthora fragariaefolia]|uniref:Unnamed protein product n=1 Tax=Phytophthora fragariaefolia TaxID=1490495 RepID=A0A9W6TWA1_9STRA|nr:unnamed protein product [Phytophthora fragariaefolia]
MRSGLLWTLQSANITINKQLNRHAWVGWVFIYFAELIFFTAYRLNNLSDLVTTSSQSNEDSTAVRVCGALLGLLEDFVVISFLLVVLSGFDAIINRSACCNDTAPNGCLDCFTRGVPVRSRTKLILKRMVRFSIVYGGCMLSVALFALDVVTVRVYRRRYEFGWGSRSEDRVVLHGDENMIIAQVLVVTLLTQGIIAALTMTWFDLARWTPLKFAENWKSTRSQRSLTSTNAQRSVNYLVMDPDDFFGSGENESLSEFFDSNDRPIRGTQRPEPRAILSYERRDLPTPKWKFRVFGLTLTLIVFIVIPLLVLLITNYCPVIVASIALNSNLNEPIRVITTISFI